MSETNRKSLLGRTRSFFGIESNYSLNEVDAWNQRRLKFCVNKFGNLNYDKMKPDSNDLSQSLLGHGPETPLRTTEVGMDVLDCSLNSPVSPVPVRPPSLSRTLTRLSHRPPASIDNDISSLNRTTLGFSEAGRAKRHHAFKAIATVLSNSFRTGKGQSVLDNKEEAQPAIMELEETIEPQFVSCMEKAPPIPGTQAAQVPLSSRASSTHMRRQRSAASAPVLGRSRMQHSSLKWSNSVVQRVRSGVRRLDARRRFTESLVGRMMCCVTQQSWTNETKQLHANIDDRPQYRPYFTYWVCLVQLVVFIVSVSVFGIAPVRLEFTAKHIGEVQMPSASIEQACRVEYVNLFVGPRQADLIRLGARYSPCMRRDPNIEQQILKPQRQRDRDSGCCVRNDGGGCYQTSQRLCSRTLSSWQRRQLSDNSSSALVCGLDPDHCDKPRSQPPFVWPTDVAHWPICQQQTNHNAAAVAGASHVRCEVTGRPCCIGAKAECVVTTRQHCAFLRGSYHPTASLCSQVNCLSEVCGMLGFLRADRPDQVYRLLTALFISPSLGSLLIGLCVQLSVMRDLEKMAGWHRISLLYLLSGMLGNLCSGIFLPYQVQCGPGGSLLALLAMTFTEFVQSWPLLQRPGPVLAKFLGLGVLLLALGCLPFLDNWAQLAGLASGILLSFVLLPFLGMPSAAALDRLLAQLARGPDTPEIALRRFQSRVRRNRLLVISLCATLWLGLATALAVLFYLSPVTSCTWCRFVNCLPLAPNLCDNMDVSITTNTACIVTN